MEISVCPKFNVLIQLLNSPKFLIISLASIHLRDKVTIRRRRKSVKTSRASRTMGSGIQNLAFLRTIPSNITITARKQWVIKWRSEMAMITTTFHHNIFFTIVRLIKQWHRKDQCTRPFHPAQRIHNINHLGGWNWNRLQSRSEAYFLTSGGNSTGKGWVAGTPAIWPKFSSIGRHRGWLAIESGDKCLH